ncbi:hypothetical protein AB1Y20_006835 [Prymnesium parvum]|uniref:Uncharacterized protein n=1 Tax=Prymnesium parvum TaxID=97485 RepID=A0AB34J2X7_PRYPA
MSGLRGGMHPEREAALRRGLSIGKDDVAHANSICAAMRLNPTGHAMIAAHNLVPRAMKLSHGACGVRSDTTTWCVCGEVVCVENDNVESREGARGAGGGTWAGDDSPSISIARGMGAGAGVTSVSVFPPPPPSSGEWRVGWSGLSVVNERVGGVISWMEGRGGMGGWGGRRIVA